MRLIVDCSVVLSWSVVSQASPLTRQAEINVQDTGGIVPFIFPIEFGNSLLMLERRGKLTARGIETAIEGLEKIDLEVDATILDEAPRGLIPLARKHRLTLYDAAYLELALRLQLPLATRDEELRSAATASGAVLFEAS